MAKTNAPMLSFGGSGQIGKSMVHATWRGITYARAYVQPSNPQTASQMKTRSVFAWLSNVWKLGSSELQAPWLQNAKGRQFTGRNKFMGDNTKALRPGVDLSAFIGSPGANGGIPATSIAAADGGTSIDVTLGVPSVPAGWALTDTIAVAVTAQDPHDGTDYATLSAASGDGTGLVSIDPVAAGDYQVVGWFVMSKPDGSLAYGASLSTTVTVA